MKYSFLLQTLMLVTLLVHTVLCGSHSQLNGPPKRPNNFRSPQKLRDYLKALNDYYAIVGRPRFGKRGMSNLDDIANLDLLKNTGGERQNQLNDEKSLKGMLQEWRQQRLHHF